MNAMEAIIHKRARGFILKCMSFYPAEATNAMVIADFVRNCGLSVLDSDVISQLDYLKSKGYAEVEELSDKRLCEDRIITGRITSKGIDLLEANIPEDPGILLPNNR